MINFELLDGAIEDAANGAHGYTHQQFDWLAPAGDTYGNAAEEPCGTAMCLAGFIAVRAGAQVPQPQYGDGEWWMPQWYLTEDGKLDLGDVFVSEWAERKAGLSGSAADALFYGGNTLDQIRAMRDHLRESPDATYADLRRVAHAAGGRS